MQGKFFFFSRYCGTGKASVGLIFWNFLWTVSRVALRENEFLRRTPYFQIAETFTRKFDQTALYVASPSHQHNLNFKRKDSTSALEYIYLCEKFSEASPSEFPKTFHNLVIGNRLKVFDFLICSSKACHTRIHNWFFSFSLILF